MPDLLPTDASFGSPPAIRASHGFTAEIIGRFASQIANDHTRRTYLAAVSKFDAWCVRSDRDTSALTSDVIDQYFDSFSGTQHQLPLQAAGLRSFFKWATRENVLPTNPFAHSAPKNVRLPRAHRVLNNPINSSQFLEFVRLLRVENEVDSRDKAILATIYYAFANPSMIVGIKIGDYYDLRNAKMLRFPNVHGSIHEVRPSVKLQEFLDGYQYALRGRANGSPFFCSARGTGHELGENPLTRTDVLRMIKRRAEAACVTQMVNCRIIRAIGLSKFMEDGGKLQTAQYIAAHKSPATTKQYLQEDVQ